MYMCIYIYIYIHVHIYIYIYIYVYVHVYVYVILPGNVSVLQRRQRLPEGLCDAGAPAGRFSAWDPGSRLGLRGRYDLPATWLRGRVLPTKSRGPFIPL